MCETRRVDKAEQEARDFYLGQMGIDWPPFDSAGFDLARKLEAENNKLRAALKGVLNSALHPEIAIRATFVQLEPIRKLLKEVDNPPKTS